jgi:hypothetical protein
MGTQLMFNDEMMSNYVKFIQKKGSGTCVIIGLRGFV